MPTCAVAEFRFDAETWRDAVESEPVDSWFDTPRSCASGRAEEGHARPTWGRGATICRYQGDSRPHGVTSV